MKGTLRIAAPVTKSAQIDDHFGHCEYYHVFTVSGTNEIVDVQIIKSAQGCGCKSDIAQVLAKQGVTVMLAGGIGNGAIIVLNAAGITVVRGCSGNAKEIVLQYIAGSIIDNGLSCQQHNPEHVCNH